MELTERQLREKAIQHTIASTFTDDGGARIEILIAALTRVIHARNGGKPLNQVKASEYTQMLRDALTSKIEWSKP